MQGLMSDSLSIWEHPTSLQVSPEETLENQNITDPGRSQQRRMSGRIVFDPEPALFLS